MSPSISQLPSCESEEVSSTQIVPSNTDLLQIWQWNHTVPQNINKSIHEYFVSCSLQHPNKTAVLSWDGQLAYGELHEFSSRLAHSIRGMGIEAGTPVLLCFEKSVWTSLAVLAVMKAGCAFVLIDPVQPEGRLRTIATEIEAKLVLTSAKYFQLGRRVAPSAHALAIDANIVRALDAVPIDDLPPVSGCSNMYIIFTSGSTGKPKGVVITHSNYTSGAIPRAEIVGYQEHTRVLDFASYAFDVSIDCMLCTFATGGCICIPSEEDRVNDLSGVIRKMEVNMVHTTPSVARILDSDIIPTLEVLGLGGEAIPPQDASTWRQQTRVIIAYGPSECTVGCAFNNDVVIGSSYTSLGKGVGGLLWIVDPSDHNKLLPIGETGELLVEGPIVGQGYLNEPEKTRTVYIDDPDWLLEGFGNHSGRRGRLYKTGDLVHYDPNASGAVVFVGRKDQQVKLRGQRIELGEVEHHVRRRLSQKVAVAAEVIKPDGQGDPTLVAFIAELSENEVGPSSCDSFQKLSQELRQSLAEAEHSLAEEVPKYMIPTAYIPVAKMPITVSGKTDRKQLQEIGSALSQKDLAKLRADQKPSIEPQTDSERKLQAVWMVVLGEGPEVGKEDNFFALGGDSLKAMKLVARAREAGFGLTVSEIFTYPTLSQMAARIQSVQKEENQDVPPFSLIEAGWSTQHARSQAAELCGVGPELIEDVYPCTALQEGLMALSAKVPEAYVAQRVLELHDVSTAQRFLQAFEKTVCEAPILRTRLVQVANRGLFQVVLRQDVQWAEVGDLNDYLTRDMGKPMELGKSLVRAAMVSSEASKTFQFVLTIHHALYDGWSMPLIVERINRNYNDLRTERPAEFRNFVKYLRGMDHTAAAGFWKDRLHGSSTRQFPALPTHDYQTKADSLLERHSVLPKASKSDKTTATILRAAWAIVSSQLSGCNDVVFGETLTGRNVAVAGIEEIEGPMITTVPMRVRLEGKSSLDLLKDIQQHTIDRIPYEHLGLQHIRRLSADARTACDLRTGLVLHPHSDEDEGLQLGGVASGLVPAGDTEAAQEALKFNSYALMLVCSLEPSGFLTMASFDSSTVSTEVMQEALEAFEMVVQRICRDDTSVLGLQQLVFSGRSALSSYRNGHRKANGLCDGSTGGPTAKPQVRPERQCVEKHQSEDDCNETLLLSICAGILHLAVDDILPRDSFFELGGDSIGAMKLVSELRQHGLILSVAQIFAKRHLGHMVSCLGKVDPNTRTSDQIVKPLTLVSSANGIVSSTPTANEIRPLLANQDWRIKKILPARPLQDIAVRGTVDLPRYSARYEMLFFHQAIDTSKLLKACQTTVDANEILRTIFVRFEDRCFGVVLEDVKIAVSDYFIDTDVDVFAQQLCELDIQTRMPLGEQFLKFMLIQGPNENSCLVLRISHAQYDEMCLPILLRQMSALYSERQVERSLPFSDFVHHIHGHSMKQAIPYWRNLLAGARITTMPLSTTEAEARTGSAISLTHRLDISQRSKAVTLATFPTAAWALTLARRLNLKDVTFGEVVSGRDIADLANGHSIMGPCWQYVPVRVRMQSDWTANDLLSAVQEQHVVSAPYSVLGLSEILENCVDDSFDKSRKVWFDSVVHQAVQGVAELDFGEGNLARTETLYPHAEPLREWKMQSFVEDEGNAMTLEIVTFDAWETVGREILGELIRSFELLMEGGDRKVMEA